MMILGRMETVISKNLNPLRGIGADWIVFSDRSDNPSYQAPGGAMLKKMEFMEAFVVLGEDETGDYLRIVKYAPDIISLNGGRLGKNANILDYGWAKKSTMLLWTKSLINKKTKFTIKGLTVHTKESLRNPKLYAGKNRVKLFSDPDQRNQNENGVNLYQVLYIYKRTNNAVLIGKDFDFTHSRAQAKVYILGWVDKNLIRSWDQRLVLEPNFDEDAAIERRNKNIKALILNGKGDAQKYHQNATADPQKVLWGNDMFEERQRPFWMRPQSLIYLQEMKVLLRQGSFPWYIISMEN